VDAILAALINDFAARQNIPVEMLYTYFIKYNEFKLKFVGAEIRVRCFLSYFDTKYWGLKGHSTHFS